MKKVAQIVFRRLTAADFFNINKPKGVEARGGGQSYIDFPTSAVSPPDWESFFADEKVIEAKSGPLWRFTVNSLGLGQSQKAEIGRRRDASYNIRAQKLGTKESNRLFAWHPQYSGFPAAVDPESRVGVPNLVIYLIRTTEGEYWAGWFQAAAPKAEWQVDERLRRMFTQDDGNIYLNPAIDFDEGDGEWAFRTGAATAAPATKTSVPTSQKPGDVSSHPPIVDRPAAVLGKQGADASKKKSPRYQQKTEDEIVASLFFDDLIDEPLGAKKLLTISVLKRNQKIVGALKALYKGQCQLTGEKYVFKKTDGQVYCEAHHLVPLGSGGADSPYNLIIVSPLIHRMLHYADVSGIDLNKIVNNTLAIEINGTPFTITWHPKHAEPVNAAARNGDGQK